MLLFPQGKHKTRMVTLNDKYQSNVYGTFSYRDYLNSRRIHIDDHKNFKFCFGNDQQRDFKKKIVETNAVCYNDIEMFKIQPHTSMRPCKY